MSEEKQLKKLEEKMKKKHKDYDNFLGDEDKCPECGSKRVSYECISTDADGNRPEYAMVCKDCGCIF